MHPQNNDASVAQLVEHLTLNQGVQGSTPCGSTRIKRVTKKSGCPLFFFERGLIRKRSLFLCVLNIVVGNVLFLWHNSKSHINSCNMLPKISIIIPIYNVEPYIEDCLQSVMRQTYRGMMECILVDDCGTDNSMKVAEQLIKIYNGPIDFKVLHHEHNRGLSAARNTGIDAACGDYVYFLDSDDWISDDCFE